MFIIIGIVLARGKLFLIILHHPKLYSTMKRSIGKEEIEENFFSEIVNDTLKAFFFF